MNASDAYTRTLVDHLKNFNIRPDGTLDIPTTKSLFWGLGVGKETQVKVLAEFGLDGDYKPLRKELLDDDECV